MMVSRGDAQGGSSAGETVFNNGENRAIPGFPLKVKLRVPLRRSTPLCKYLSIYLFYS